MLMEERCDTTDIETLLCMRDGGKLRIEAHDLFSTSLVRRVL